MTGATAVMLGIAAALVAALFATSGSAAPSGGGSNLVVRSATVEGRRYHIIHKGHGIYEIMSADVPEDWIVFDASEPGDTVRPLSAHGDSETILIDMHQFPKDLFK